MLPQKDFSHAPRRKEVGRCLKHQPLLRLVEDRLITSEELQSRGFQSPTLPPMLKHSGRTVHIRLLPIDLSVEGLDAVQSAEIEQLCQNSTIALAIQHFSANVAYLKAYQARLTALDERIEGVIRPILDMTGIVIRDLDECGMAINLRTISLNLNVFCKLAAFSLHQTDIIPDEWLGMALTVYFLHEINHSSQGIARYEDVKAVKSVNQTSGKRLILELDLRSDYLAAHTLSVLMTLRKSPSYNIKIYEDSFYFVWCKVCRGMLETFSIRKTSRKDKVRRIFGYFLMAHVLRESYQHNSPIKLNGELLPDWDSKMTKLSIQSNRQPWIHGAPVDSTIMRKIHRLIWNEDYDQAENEISRIWRTLPK
jgi:hypothetical protein